MPLIARILKCILVDKAVLAILLLDLIPRVQVFELILKFLHSKHLCAEADLFQIGTIFIKGLDLAFVVFG